MAGCCCWVGFITVVVKAFAKAGFVRAVAMAVSFIAGLSGCSIEITNSNRFLGFSFLLR